MKKIITTCVATMGLATGVFAQGSILVDNSSVGGGLSIGSSQANGQGNFFYGDMTLQVWYLNASTVPANLTSDSNLTTTGLTAYNNLTADGFTLAQTYADQNITQINAGQFSLGELDMPNAAANIIVALVAWSNGQGATTAPAGTFAGSPFGGVFAFANPTAAYETKPTPLPDALSGWSGQNDLVMAAVPEPTTMALAGLGGLSLFLLRRKK